MGKRRHTKNKKRKMIGGEGGNYPLWKRVRDLYNPVRREKISPSLPYRRSPRSRRPPLAPKTFLQTQTPSDTGVTVDTNPDVDQSNILNVPSAQWNYKKLYGIRGGARRKSKSSKKKRKQKRKTQKRKSSNKRKYTKRR